jgi:amino acid transporter
VTVVMYLWASKEVVEKQFNKINPKLIVVFIITASFFISLYPKIMRDVDRIIEVLAYAATGVAFLLPLLLLVIAAFSKKNIQEQAHE